MARNNNRNNNRNKKRKNDGLTPPSQPSAPAGAASASAPASGIVNGPSPAAATPTFAAAPSGQGAVDTAEGNNMFLNFIAQQRPQETFGGQMLSGGQLTGSGPPVYENWVQNQFYNQQYLNYMSQMQANPQLSFRDYLANQGGPAGLAAQAQNQYNALTPYQRGLQRNPFAAGTGRFVVWG